MPTVTAITGDLFVSGNIQRSRDSLILPGISRTEQVQSDLQEYPILPMDWKIWDAFATDLTGTSGTDDLGLYAGAFATGCPYVSTGDVKTLTVTRYARTVWQVPLEFVTGQRITLRANAGMITTVASSLATVDFEIYKMGENALISGSDINATAAQSCNSLTFAELSYTVTTATLAPGDLLDIRLTIAVTDAATATAVIAALGAMKIAVDIKG